MKKIYLLFVLLLSCVYISLVKAEAADGVIELDKNLVGEEISNYRFKFILKDLDGNIIQTKENAGSKISFDPIKYTDSDIGETYYYTVVEENDSQKGIEYDDAVIYISVKVGEDKTNVYYASPNWYKEKKTAQPFHATSEDLEGEAYAVYDINTKELTFFRDENNEYQDGEVRGDKVYFANIEIGWNSWVYNQYSYQKIEKIIFKDAVKPTSINSWFWNMHALKEVDISKLDTSLITDLSSFMKDCPNVRKLDISTMDVSNVVRLDYAFRESGIEELDFTVWDLDHLEGTRPLQEFVNSMPNLKYLDISNFPAIDSSAEFANLPCLEYVHLGNKYKFLNASLDGGGKSFIKLEDHKVYSPSEIKIPYSVDVGTIGGHYVRPACTTNAEFNNSYKKYETIEKSVVLKITDNMKITDLVPDYKGDIEVNIKDETIIKIDNGSIIPLKSGETVVMFTINKKDYYLKVIVENNIEEKTVDNKAIEENPNTGDKIIAVVLLILISLGIFLFLYKRKESRY